MKEIEQHLADRRAEHGCVEVAKKFDAGKARVDLIPPCIPRIIGEVLGFGAKKYGPNNWAKGDGIEWSRTLASLERHLIDFKEGRMHDAESGLSSLGHALTQLVILVASVEYGYGVDDRFPWIKEKP